MQLSRALTAGGRSAAAVAIACFAALPLVASRRQRRADWIGMRLHRFQPR